MDCIICDCAAEHTEREHCEEYRAALCREHQNELDLFLRENVGDVLAQISKLQASACYFSKMWILDKIKTKSVSQDKNWLPAESKIGLCLYEGADSGGRYYRYADGVWRVIPEDSIRKMARVELGDRATPKKINDALRAFRERRYRSWGNLGFDPMCLNFRNGMLHVKTRRLVSHQPEFYSRVQLPVEYRKDAECPHWLEALGEIFGDDKNKVQVLKEFFGYCLYLRILSRMVLFQTGSDDRGKEFVGVILCSMLGKENVSHLSLAEFGKRAGSGLTRLRGKSLNIMDAAGQSFPYDPLFNSLTAGYETMVGTKYRLPVIYRPIAKHIISMNTTIPYRELLVGKSAYYKGFVPLEYNRMDSFDCEDRETVFKSVSDEIPGVVNWALDGLEAVLENPLFSARIEIWKEAEVRGSMQ